LGLRETKSGTGKYRKSEMEEKGGGIREPVNNWTTVTRNREKMMAGRTIWPGPCKAPGEKTLGEGTGQGTDVQEDVTFTDSWREHLRWMPRNPMDQSKRQAGC
jgi:hypothetical protein